MSLHRALENLIQLRRAELRAITGDDAVDRGEDLLDAPAALRRDELHWRVLKELELEADHVLELLRLILLMRSDIPLVDEDQRGLPCLVGIPGDSRILRRHAVDRVDEHER